MRRFVLRLAALIGVAVLCSLQATAIPTTITTNPLAIPGGCDPLVVPLFVDELGNPPVPPPPTTISGPFPVGEQIASLQIQTTAVSACPTSNVPDSPLIPNRQVVITNLQPFAFVALWYVADPETLVRNVDGIINGYGAFQIDAIGLNTPLIAESILADGIFAPGESWTFIIQDFANNLGSSPAAFASIGVGSFSAGSAASSGSIIGIPVPEPASGALLGLSLLALAAGRRRARS